MVTALHMLTSNRSVKDWAQIFAGDTLTTTAILNRLFHKAHLFNIDGKSYRLGNFEQGLQDQEGSDAT